MTDACPVHLPTLPAALASLVREECARCRRPDLATPLLGSVEDTVQVVCEHPDRDEVWLLLILRALRMLGEDEVADAVLCRYTGCLASRATLRLFARVDLSPALVWMLRSRLVRPGALTASPGAPWLAVTGERLAALGGEPFELGIARGLRAVLTACAPVFDASRGEGAWDLRSLAPEASPRQRAWMTAYARACLDDQVRERGWIRTPTLLAA